jgi:hypothetical protein
MKNSTGFGFSTFFCIRWYINIENSEVKVKRFLKENDILVG